MSKKISDEEKSRIVELRVNWYKYKDIAEIIKQEFKKDNVSLWTIYNILNEEDNEYIDEETNKAIDDMIEERTKKYWTKNYHKKVNESLSYVSWVKSITELFDSVLDKYEFNEYKYKRAIEETPEPWTTQYVFVGDLHYWRWTKFLRENWWKMIYEIEDTDFENKDIVFFLMWDLIESPRVTWMHDAQVPEMEYLWIEQALWCVDLLAEGFRHLLDFWYGVSVIWMNWNHVRMSKSRDWDPERIVGSFMYEMLKRMFPGMKIEYTKDWVIQYTDRYLHFILSHWDWWFNNKSDTAIVQALWEVGKLNIIASWHWHCSSLSQWNWYIRIKTPSLNWQSEYEKNKFISKSLPWYVTMSMRDKKYPKIDFRFLP